MPGWLQARSVIEGKSVEEAVDRFARKFGRFKEAFEALKWLLARSCDSVAYVSYKASDAEYCLYKQASDPLAKTPSIVVLYTYDDNEVVLININAKEAEPETD